MAILRNLNQTTHAEDHAAALEKRGRELQAERDAERAAKKAEIEKIKNSPLLRFMRHAPGSIAVLRKEKV